MPWSARSRRSPDPRRQLTLDVPTGLPAPDRITVWPLERGRVGVDVVYHGTSGAELGAAVGEALKASRIPHKFRTEPDGGSAVRLTVAPSQAGQVVSRFLEAAN